MFAIMCISNFFKKKVIQKGLSTEEIKHYENLIFPYKVYDVGDVIMISHCDLANEINENSDILHDLLKSIGCRVYVEQKDHSWRIYNENFSLDWHDRRIVGVTKDELQELNRFYPSKSEKINEIISAFNYIEEHL
jgi:hypothetical protein